MHVVSKTVFIVPREEGGGGGTTYLFPELKMTQMEL